MDLEIEVTIMKLIEALSTALLFLLPVAIVPAYAQKEHEEEKQPQQKQQQAKPAQQPKQAQRQQQAKPAQQQQRAQRQQQAKPAQQQQRAQQQQQAKPAQQQQRPERQQQANREQPAASHGRIPDDRFRASFGREHSFHVNRSDFEGSRRFQYGGFWFNVLDPWPVGWLYTDNVYVDYINGGYFLCNPVHPGVYISINIG
jgi:flagellar motor protein MotB